MIRFLAVTLVAATLAMPATVHAELSKKVISTFKGQLIISAGELPSGEDDRATIAAIKKVQLAEVSGEKNDEDVMAWRFSYTAFVSKNGPTSLKMAFYTVEKKPRYVADQRLDGIDPKSPVLVGDVAISEDDGLTKGHRYTIKLIAVIGSKESTVASTTLTMN
jgi:hypothetical protein